LLPNGVSREGDALQDGPRHTRALRGYVHRGALSSQLPVVARLRGGRGRSGGRRGQLPDPVDPVEPGAASGARGRLHPSARQATPGVCRVGTARAGAFFNLSSPGLQPGVTGPLYVAVSWLTT